MMGKSSDTLLTIVEEQINRNTPRDTTLRLWREVGAETELLRLALRRRLEDLGQLHMTAVSLSEQVYDLKLVDLRDPRLGQADRLAVRLIRAVKAERKLDRLLMEHDRRADPPRFVSLLSRADEYIEEAWWRELCGWIITRHGVDASGRMRLHWRQPNARERQLFATAPPDPVGDDPGCGCLIDHHGSIATVLAEIPCRG
jgi:hypothetical protein